MFLCSPSCVRVALIAIPTVGGGFALASGMEDDCFPEECLADTLFRNHVVLGLIHAVMVGGTATIAAVATWRNQHAAGPRRSWQAAF